jgi:replication factor C small subunit
MLSASREKRYHEALDILKDLTYHQGVSPVDLIRQIHREVLSSELPEQEKMNVLERTAEAEFRISEGADGEIQLAALLAFMGL